MKTTWIAMAAALAVGGGVALGQTPLTITCPTNLTVWTCGTNPVPVTYPPPVVAGGCRGNTINCTPASGSLFPLGVRTVTCEAVDSCTNRAICSFTVTVLRDTNAPTIACPSNLTVPCVDNVPPRPATLAQFLAAGGQAADNHDTSLAYACTDGPLSGGAGGPRPRARNGAAPPAPAAGCGLRVAGFGVAAAFGVRPSDWGRIRRRASK